MRSDEELLADYRNSRNTSAFEEIVRRHGAFVVRAATRVLGNPTEAEDVMQSVFLVLAQKPEAVSRSLPGWLHEVAWRTAKKVLRARARRQRREVEAALQSSPGDDGHSALELRQELDAAMAQLPHRLREAVIVRYLEGRAQEEAARVIGCPRSTLVERSTEGLQRLRAVLGRRGVLVSAPVLAALLTTEVAASCVRVIALTTASSAVAPQAGAASATAALAQSAAKHMAWAAKAKLGGAALLGALTVGTAVTMLAPAQGSPRWNGPIVERATLSGHKGEVGSLAFSPDSTVLASGSYDGHVKLWDVASLKEKQHLDGASGHVHAVAFSPDGKLVAASTDRRSALVWTREGRQVASLGDSGRNGFVCFSPDGKLLASAAENVVKLFDVGTQRELAALTGHRGLINRSAFSPDGNWLATSSYDGTVRVWDVSRRKIHQVLEGHQGCIAWVAFSPDSKRLASAGWDRTARVWDVASGTTVHMLKGHAAQVSSIAFTPDGSVIATGSFDHHVKLWDAASGVELATLAGHNQPIYGVAFAPDGKTLASASLDRTVKLWVPGH